MFKNPNHFNILSLDGGGSWAMIQVKALRKLFNDSDAGHLRGHEVLRHFDLSIANSGGSIVLGALACNILLKDIEDVYLQEEKLRQVFRPAVSDAKKVTSWLVKLLQFDINRYETTGKRTGLLELFNGFERDQGGSTLKVDDLLSDFYQKEGLRLVFTVFDYLKNRSSFFRSDIDSLASKLGLFNQTDKVNQASLLDALHGSTNAPVLYFNHPARIDLDPTTDNPMWGWDGAIGGYNNPSLAGVVEAVANGVALDNIRMLSIGTGLVIDPVQYQLSGKKLLYKRFKVNGLLSSRLSRDILKMAKSIVADPPDAASYIAMTLMFPGAHIKDTQAVNKRFIRLNPMMKPKQSSYSADILGNLKLWDIADENMFEGIEVEPNSWEVMSMAETRLARFANIDIDAIKQWEINLINRFCECWMDGKVNNQSVRGPYGGDQPGYLGQVSFQEGCDAFQEW